MSDTRNTKKDSNPIDNPVTDEWSLDRFERWVRVGVESYVVEDLGPAAFPEAAHHILNTSSLPQGLRAFAAGLNAARLDNLKRAVAQVLSSLEPQERYVLVAEQLLAIAVAISAYPVLDVLAHKIGGGFFGQPDAEGRDSLFAMTLYSVASLASVGREDAERCLNELIESENFKPAHASTALLALCEVDPRGLSRHLSAPGLRKKLAEQFSTYDDNGALRRQVAQTILPIIGIKNFKDALYELKAFSPFDAGPSTDDWLAESLIFAPDAPLEIVIDNDDVKLCYRKTPTDCVLFKRRSTGAIHQYAWANEPPVTGDDLAGKSAEDLDEEITARLNYFFQRTPQTAPTST